MVLYVEGGVGRKKKVVERRVERGEITYESRSYSAASLREKGFPAVIVSCYYRLLLFRLTMANAEMTIVRK
jgi:hypothetical protein